MYLKDIQNMASYNRLDNQKAKNDISLECKIGDFVFENFWSKLGAKERVNDKWLQIRGVDVKVGDWNVDEKVKYYDSKTKGFMTELLRYPSFEISFENQSGVLQKGWFMNSENITTHYAFIQPFSIQPDPKKFTIRDLTKVNLLLVKKSDMDVFKKAHDLELESSELRSSFKTTNERRRRFPGLNYWLTYTPTFHEQPVNLVVPRDVLKALPNTREFEIDNNGKLTELKG